MKRDDLEHLIRAAAQVIDEQDILVIGSQAILGSFDDSDEAKPTLDGLTPTSRRVVELLLHPSCPTFADLSRILDVPRGSVTYLKTPSHRRTLPPHLAHPSRVMGVSAAGRTPCQTPARRPG